MHLSRDSGPSLRSCLGLRSSRLERLKQFRHVQSTLALLGSIRDSLLGSIGTRCTRHRVPTSLP
eukprot:3285648-Alexandrium_andersonii.AAC.1